MSLENYWASVQRLFDINVMALQIAIRKLPLTVSLLLSKGEQKGRLVGLCTVHRDGKSHWYSIPCKDMDWDRAGAGTGLSWVPRSTHPHST